MPIGNEASYVRLERLLSGREGDTIRQLDQYVWRHEPVNTIVILTIKSSLLSKIGPALTQIDRELRRAVSILGAEPNQREAYYFGRPGFRPYPLPASKGGLLVYDASAGSLNLIAEAYGAVLTLLNSQPVGALCTVYTLCQIPASVRTWIHGRKRAGNSLSNVRQVLMESQADVTKVLPGDPPDYELDIGPTEGDAQFTASIEPEIQTATRAPHHYETNEQLTVENPIKTIRRESVYQTEDFEVRGSEITVVHIFADGTQRFVNVKS